MYQYGIILYCCMIVYMFVCLFVCLPQVGATISHALSASTSGVGGAAKPGGGVV